MAAPTSSTCHFLAPSESKCSRTISGEAWEVEGAGGAQHIRRTISGVIRFSIGILFSSAIISMRARACERGAYFSGNLSRHNLIGGNVSALVRRAGHSDSSSATARATASSQAFRFSNQRARSPSGRNTFSNSFLVATGLSAISTIAESLSSLPPAISCDFAISSRVTQSSRIIAN